MYFIDRLYFSSRLSLIFSIHIKKGEEEEQNLSCSGSQTNSTEESVAMIWGATVARLEKQSFSEMAGARGNRARLRSLWRRKW